MPKSQEKIKKADWRLWAILIVTLVTLGYTVISSYAIRGNELKHIVQRLDKIEKRLERLENTYIK